MSQQKYFEFGDKPHKLLARQLKKLENDRMIHKIRSRNGNLVTSHKDINDNFRQFYESLYTSHSLAGLKDMQDFLDKCDLPVLDQVDRNILNAKITTEEITKSIGLKNGKSPGPDGLGNGFYKQFKIKLVPYLLKLYNHAYKAGTLPPTLNEAIVTVLPKKR